MLQPVFVWRGAPDPAAPPCIPLRFFPLTAGDMQGLPERILAPQRGLDSNGPVLRAKSTKVVGVRPKLFNAGHHFRFLPPGLGASSFPGRVIREANIKEE
jgi:hypothetical protein